MIDFRAPEPSDKQWVDELLRAGDERGCEYNFTNLYAWSRPYQQKIARLDGRLLVSADGLAGPCYLWPVGSGDVKPAIEALWADAKERGEPFRLACLTAEHVQELERLWPGGFLSEPDRDGFDYLYEVDRLAELGGKRLHAKRNHINRFVEQNGDWVYEELTGASLPDCMRMDEEWYRRSREREGAEEAQDLNDEGVALRAAMEHFAELKLEGGLIRVYGEVVAFTIGDRLNSDTYNAHFEKAYGELQGAYAIINREFSAWVRKKYPDVKYINREDDMGVEGLRKAKESYYPDRMVEKYIAVQSGK
ncbi:MAG: DUF2156 domain-containing protein [Clostridia bacterium]|nr:DUF2156 domain-containing protein [Clostridia bacterium]